MNNFYNKEEFEKEMIALDHEHDLYVLAGVKPQWLITEERKEQMLDRRLSLLKDNLYPCPICGTTNLSTKEVIQYGQGECFYNSGRVTCNCGFSYGNFAGYGLPSKKDYINWYRQYNKMIKHNSNEIY